MSSRKTSSPASCPERKSQTSQPDLFCVSYFIIGLLNISNRRHENRVQNRKYDSELEHHRQEREKHPTYLAAKCLAARPHDRLAKKQSHYRDQKKQRPDKYRWRAWD